MKLHDMRFRVKEGVTREGTKFVKTISERDQHEIVQRVKESVEEEWDRIELGQSNERVMQALDMILSGHKGPTK
jgi:hypothetical protein